MVRISQKKLDLLKKIIDAETKSGIPISVNQLHERSGKYVENGKRMSRDTISKYMPYLWKDVWVLRTQNPRGKKGSRIISKGENYDIYLARKDIPSRVESLDGGWFPRLKNLLIKMKRQNPDMFFDRYCLTFIGDVPVAFNKSTEGMQSHIAFEKDLRLRHERDLERFREEFMGASKSTVTRVIARAREEVGWTIGEYLRKLLEKAEKQKGVRKIMTVLGIDEEMLEEMYREKGWLEEKS